MEQESLKVPSYGSLWKEFDETLVFSNNENILANTLDASCFFNADTLARGVTGSRLLAAVPGFLTAIGVLGTFAGLQLGIGGLNLDTSNTEILKHGIASVVHGASIAFMTSVWGVALSVTFNFIEKLVESFIRSKITKLQDEIDCLFPRINAEQSLIDISSSSKASEEVLMGLAEKIGARMQETVVQMSDTVQLGMENSLQKIMGPAIEKLVEASSELAGRQADGSQKVLEELIGKFVDGLGKEGKKQQELMADTSGEVKVAMEAWGNDMNDFLLRLEQQFTAVEEESRKRNQLVEDQLSNNSSFQKENSELLTRQLTEIMTRFSKDMEDKQEKMAETDGRRQTTFEVQMNQLNQKQETMMNALDVLIGKHVDATKSVVTQGEILGKGIMDMQSSMEIVSTRMDTAGERLQKAATSLQQTTDNVNHTNATMAGAVLDATHSNTEMSNQNKEVAFQFKSLLSTMNTLKTDFSHTTELLKRASQSAESTFNDLVEHQDGYRVTLSNHIEEVSKQVDNLMKSYAKQLDETMINYAKHVQGQTHNRMVAWDRETQSYTLAMQGIVNAMQNLVDDMDSITARSMN